MWKATPPLPPSNWSDSTCGGWGCPCDDHYIHKRRFRKKNSTQINYDENFPTALRHLDETVQQEERKTENVKKKSILAIGEI